MNTRFSRLSVTASLLSIMSGLTHSQILVPVDAGGPIPDQIEPTTFTFTVNQSVAVGSVTLRFSASHEFIPDLAASLISPSGTTVELFSNVGLGGAGYFQDVLFTDSAPSRIDPVGPSQITGQYQVQFEPDNLSVFNGENSSGQWKLRVTDLFVGSDSGYLYKNGDNTDLTPSSLTRFGIAQGTELTLVPVPEPSAYAGILGIVALGFGVARRRLRPA